MNWKPTIVAGTDFTAAEPEAEPSPATPAEVQVKQLR